MSERPRFVHWEGRVLPVEEARVSVLDAGFLYGDGVYETMRSYGAGVFAVARHLDRLARSAEPVELALPPRDELRRAIEETVRANGFATAAVRLTVTRGRLERRLDLSSAVGPSVLVTVDPLDPADDDVRHRGVRVIYSKWLRAAAYPLAGVKSTNYQVSLLARNEAREAGAREVLVANESGDIIEAAAANVFAVERGRLVTPPLYSGILGGITREVVTGLARARGIDVREETLPRSRVENADELFLSGTSIQITPVVRVEERTIADGQPGPITRRILADYLEAVRADTASVPGEPSERIR